MDSKRLVADKQAPFPRGNLLTMTAPEGEKRFLFFDDAQFQHILHREKIRAERLRKPLLLMLLDVSAATNGRNGHKASLSAIESAISPALREVDIRGWYAANRTVGIIFTEITSIDSNSIEVIVRKLYRHLSEQFDPDMVKQISMFFHVFPTA